MHAYQIEEETRTRKMLLLVFSSVISAYFLNVLIQSLPAAIPWWIDYPSVLGFYGIYSWLFDTYIWKLRFMQKWDWLLIPNLNGNWNVEIKSSHNNFTEKLSSKLHIRQTGSRILISMQTDNSNSLVYKQQFADLRSPDLLKSCITI